MGAIPEASSWAIGSNPGNDLVVALPKVSGRHCRLTREGEGYVLEDLGSANGTYLNGARIAGPTRVSRNDRITLGLTVPMPWPEEATARAVAIGDREVVIGRAPECDLILDLPTISWKHARVTRSEGRLWIEDLGSANGVHVNGLRIVGRSAVELGDRVALGTYPLAFVDEPEGPPVDATPEGDARAPGKGGGRPDQWRLAAVVGQAPLVAMAIVAAGRGFGPASALYGLGLAAFWFGVSDAVVGGLLDSGRIRAGLTPTGAGSIGSRLLILGLLGASQCALILVVGPDGPRMALLGMLVLTWAVGFGLGLLAMTAAPRPAAIWWGLAPIVAAVGLLGGGPWAPPRMPGPVRWVAEANPLRWTFEGLLILESGESGGRVEDYFPADTDRMGLRADSMALGAMLVGLIGSAAFQARVSGGDRRGFPAP